MSKIRYMTVALLGAASLLLSGCAGGSAPEETDPVGSVPVGSDPVDTSMPAETTDPAPEAGEGDADGSASETTLPDGWEDLVTLAVNDLTIECENWCGSPEQDQFAAVNWSAITDQENLYKFRVYEGEGLELNVITEDHEHWPAWSDVISANPNGQFVEVIPIVMDVDRADCSGSDCVAAGEVNTTEGVRLLYEVSTGEAVYAGISGTD
ncbi:hypothetical protein [Gulosibacter chungangensis]|uniref:Lipoprotein n=1 Tax=Gulosibacter chungangensis TaxID=979746 RepID=A0A7J5B9D8_9MICO|nr:hypothetical protein [Gulosibacter chungangensis]KAB1642231.1 hypothetical protein F8O05_10440 [Gulosibacter chungangensis]